MNSFDLIRQLLKVFGHYRFEPESSFQELVDGPEVCKEYDDVGHLAADELEEVPAVVVEDGLEVLDVLLYDRFENYPVVVVALFLQQDR